MNCLILAHRNILTCLKQQEAPKAKRAYGTVLWMNSWICAVRQKSILPKLKHRLRINGEENLMNTKLSVTRTTGPDETTDHNVTMTSTN